MDDSLSAKLSRHEYVVRGVLLGDPGERKTSATGDGKVSVTLSDGQSYNVSELKVFKTLNGRPVSPYDGSLLRPFGLTNSNKYVNFFDMQAKRPVTRLIREITVPSIDNKLATGAYRFIQRALGGPEELLICVHLHLPERRCEDDVVDVDELTDYKLMGHGNGILPVPTNPDTLAFMEAILKSLVPNLCRHLKVGIGHIPFSSFVMPSMYSAPSSHVNLEDILVDMERAHNS